MYSGFLAGGLNSFPSSGALFLTDKFYVESTTILECRIKAKIP